jgi:acyl carrier protein
MSLLSLETKNNKIILAMETKVLEIINDIRAAKSMNTVVALNETDNLRNDLGLTSFDLAELTVRIEDEFDIDIFEDGLVNTVGEIYAKLQK